MAGVKDLTAGGCAFFAARCVTIVIMRTTCNDITSSRKIFLGKAACGQQTSSVSKRHHRYHDDVRVRRTYITLLYIALCNVYNSAGILHTRVSYFVWLMTGVMSESCECVPKDRGEIILSL